MCRPIALSLLVPVILATSALAHGHVSQIVIAGKSFAGNVPNGPKGPSVIRQISSPDPNHGADNVALTCGPDSTPGSDIADANPGDEVTFNWQSGTLGPWPHDTGPMMTYMASCGNVTCDKFDIAQSQWFKIQQVGRKANGNGTWEQRDLMQGGVATTQIPSNLAPGNYLIRHEIIALHLADQGPGNAEFYPSCSQLRVGGNQTGLPQESDLVSIPGAYKDSDPGLDDKDVFNANVEYIFPGPPIATISDSASGGSSVPSGTGIPSSTLPLTIISTSLSTEPTAFSTAVPSTFSTDIQSGFSTVVTSATAADETVTVFTTTTLGTSVPTTTHDMKTVTVTVTASADASSPTIGDDVPAPPYMRIRRYKTLVNYVGGRHIAFGADRI